MVAGVAIVVTRGGMVVIVAAVYSVLNLRKVLEINSGRHRRLISIELELGVFFTCHYFVTAQTEGGGFTSNCDRCARY